MSVENLPAGSATVVLLTAPGALGAPKLNGVPAAVTTVPRRLAEYARPPPSRPLPLKKRAPSVTRPITLYDDDMFTAPLVALAAVTVRLTVAVLLRLPDLPVMVTVDVPVAAEAVAARVRIAVAPFAPALNDPDTPAGNPDRVTVTVPVNPFCAVKVSVLLPAAPCAMLSEVGAADNVNAGGNVTVIAMLVLAVRAPEVPVIVTAAVAAAAALDAVKVTVPWPAEIAPKVAVTPAGSPEADNATVPLKPFKAVIATVLAPLAPGVKLTLAGVAERVKLGGAAIVSEIVALLLTVPDVPVTVTVEVPSAVLAVAFRVSVVVCAAVDAGLNVAVTPAGRPVAENVTVPLKLPCGVTLNVLVPLPPCRILRLAGDGAIVRPLAAVTVKPMVAVPRKLPDVPVMVTVEVPGTAVAPAVNVSVLDVVAVAGLKEAVTPAGSPDAARATLPAKPFCRLMVMVPAPDPPGARLKLAGNADSVNPEAAVMVSDTRAVLVKLPEVPVMVSADVAAAAELLAISVSVLVVMALTGLNDAVTPAGKPAMVRFTALLKPSWALTVMLLVPVAPAAIETVDTDDDRLNAGAFDAPVKPLIKGCPAGVPQPVARS